MIRKYFIAGLNISIDFDNDIVFEERLSDYIVDNNNESDVHISVIKTKSDIKVQNKDIIKLSDISFFYSTEEKDVVFYYDTSISKAVAKIEFLKSYRNIKVFLYDLKGIYGAEDSMLMFNVLNCAICYLIQMRDGFVFHSSSICADGAGVAFSAKSGTGKSTHTRLWLDNIPGTFILNDDTPIIFMGCDNKFYISGTPWAGTTGINKNATVPLKAIVFLERGEKNKVSSMSPQEAMQPFFEGIRTPITDEMFSNCLNTLNKLFLSVPLYRLECNMNPEAAIIAYNGIFGGNKPKEINLWKE